MKLSEQWLREWVNPNEPTASWLQQLTMAGFEVENYLPVAATFTKVVVGQITALHKHPNAERLTICRVNVAADKILNIVCGGTNLELDMKVPVALVGALLPGGLTIKAAKLRGEPSEGMICASHELGLGDAPKGHILSLASDAPIGISLLDYLKLDDHQIEFAITPNRGDCLSVQGMARELAAISDTVLQVPKFTTIAAQTDKQVKVSVSAPQACPRYLACVISDIDLSMTTPSWLTERLRRSGLRSIDPVVDVTNYVMLELGQPMHAFDADKIGPAIEVRLASPGESLVLLDDSELSLEASDLLITDSEKAIALAGIMGAKHSAITASSSHILLESAYFDAQTIAKTLRRTGLSSEASQRFERGVDFELAKQAMERATALLLEIVGGAAGPVVTAVAQQHLPQRSTVSLRADRLQAILGIDIEPATVSQLFKRLALPARFEGDRWHVSPPSYRGDLLLEIDLIEEIARIYGLEQIKATAMPLSLVSQTLPAALQKPPALEQLQQVLCQRGYRQVINYSFVSPHWQATLIPEPEPIRLTNPISSELAAMRLSLWPGLLQVVQYNQKRQQSRIRIFEHGLRFIPHAKSCTQEAVIAGVAAGNIVNEQWAMSSAAVDFFDIKADVLALLDLSLKQVIFEPTQHPSLHPSQSACIKREGVILGYVGMIHPQVQQQLKLEGAIALFELNIAAVLESDLVVFQALNKFPCVRRDIAVVVDTAITVAELLSEVRKVAKEYLIDSFAFDIYQGQGIAKGKKSVALGLILQHASRTLQDDEVEALMQQVVQCLGEQYQAELRQ